MKFLFGFLLSISFFVAFSAQAQMPAYADNIGFGMDGSWYDPTPDVYGQSLDGQGFDVKFIKRHTGVEELIAYWYTYDSTGTKQVWFIAGGSIVGNSSTLTVYRATGGKFNVKTPPINEVAVGTLIFTLVDCNHAQVSWTFNQSFEGISGAGYQNLTRLTPILSIAGYDLCSTPLSYFDPDQNDNDYNSLLAEYNSLLSDYNYLYGQYNYLTGEYDGLVDDYNDLLYDYNDLYNTYQQTVDDDNAYIADLWDQIDYLNDLLDQCYYYGGAGAKSAVIKKIAKRPMVSKLPKKVHSQKVKKAKIIPKRTEKK